MNPSSAPVAVVTGAARGIGLATTRAFLGAGWHVGLVDIDGDGVTRAAASLGADDRTMAITADVSDGSAIGSAVAAIHARFGRLDGLVNNAGTAVFKTALETTEAEWNRVLSVNLSGAFLAIQAAAPLIAQTGGGSIVNITSISGLRASTLRVAYGTSKAALAHLTRQMAVELAGHGIRVNAVAPGPVDTAMAKAVHSPAIRAAYHEAIPLNRYGLEEEIAAAILFLCSPAASYVTGQELAVDGGFDAAGIGLPALRAGQK